MNGSEKSEMDLFTEAMQLPVEQRSAFLVTACGGDVKLRANVEALLKAHMESGDFLEQAPAEIKAQNTLPGEKPGDRLGRYKLLRHIVEARCAVASMPHPKHPLPRPVPIKLAHPG